MWVEDSGIVGENEEKLESGVCENLESRLDPD